MLDETKGDAQPSVRYRVTGMGCTHDAAEIEQAAQAARMGVARRPRMESTARCAGALGGHGPPVRELPT